MNNNKDSITRLLNISLFIFLFLIYGSYSGILSIILNKFNISLKDMSTLNKSILLILCEFLLVLVISFIYRKELKEEFVLYKNNFKKYFLFSLKYWGLGLLIMGISNVIIQLIFKVTPNNEENVQLILKKLPLYITITSIFFAPILEELIFRKSFKKCFKNEIIFMFSSGLLFGLMHVLSSNNLLGLLYIIPYGTFGVIFSYMYNKTETIFTSIFIHMIHNSILVMLSLISTGVIWWKLELRNIKMNLEK